MIKYKTSYDARIESVEVVRETEQFVVLPASGRNNKERRDSKRSNFGNYHDTWAEAHAYLLDRAARRLEGARRSLQNAQGEYGNIQGMKPPNDTPARKDVTA